MMILIIIVLLIIMIMILVVVIISSEAGAGAPRPGHGAPPDDAQGLVAPVPFSSVIKANLSTELVYSLYISTML